MIDVVVMGCADVGANCDFWCWLAGLFTFLAGLAEYGRNPLVDYLKRRENDRKRQEWYRERRRIANEYMERYPDWRNRRDEWPPLPPRPEYAPVPIDPLMLFYKFYQDTATFVGGPEKKQSIPAGKA